MWKIGNVNINNQMVLAPMAGITNCPFRFLAKKYGCSLVFSEMISAKGLCYGGHKMKSLLHFVEEERPFGYQLFGNNPTIMSDAARVLEARGADVIDINMGCPVPKVVKNGEGAALMRKPDLVEEIIKAVMQSVNVPITVKIRAGWDDNERNATEIAICAEKAGAQALTVHGRTREQLYNGRADWEIIKEVREAVSVPVIGNGDVFTPQDAQLLLEKTGCSAIMIGRGALGNPWIFHRILHYLNYGELLPEPDAGERLFIAMCHLEMMIILKGEYVGVQEMRKHAGWYLKGFPGAARFRNKLKQASTQEEMSQLLQDFFLLHTKGFKDAISK